MNRVSYSDRVDDEADKLCKGHFPADSGAESALAYFTPSSSNLID